MITRQKINQLQLLKKIIKPYTNNNIYKVQQSQAIVAVY